MNKFDIFKLTEFDYDKHCYVEMVTTDVCNQFCEYCHWNEARIDKLKGNISLEEFQKVLDFIEIQERETVEFNFYGGEPTLNPKLPEMITMLNSRFGDKVKIITLLTNLTKSYEYYHDLFCDPLRIICSLHTSQCENPKKWMEKAAKLEPKIEKLRLVLSETNCKTVLNLYNTYVDFWGDKLSLHIIDQLSMEDVNDLLGDEIVGKNFYKDTDTESHANSEHVSIVSNGKELEAKYCIDCHNFQGMMCSAGFVVLRNGDVLKCWKDMGHRKLLNVFKDDLKKLPVWEMCRYKKCSCDERFTKISIKEFIKK